MPRFVKRFPARGWRAHPVFGTLRLCVIALGGVGANLMPVTDARATDLSLNGALGDAAHYSVIYTGTGGHNLQITNVSISSNVGVGGTGKVKFSGPGTIGGEVDFAAAPAAQFSNNNAGNTGPFGLVYSDSQITSDLSQLSSLSTLLGGVTGTALGKLTSSQTLSAANAQSYTDSSTGITYRVFNVSSFKDGNGDILTIDGSGSSTPVIFNMTGNANYQLEGAINLTGGLSASDVLWNFTGSGNFSLNNNASSYPNRAWQGTILDLNGTIAVTNANLNGRVFGGGSGDMQIVSGSTIVTPTVTTTAGTANTVPEPGSLALVCIALFGLGMTTRWRCLLAAVAHRRGLAQAR